MLFEWNEQTFRWFREASEYTGYDKALSKLLLKHLDSCETLCDMGCGMGFADLELAPFFQEITCVDISPAVIQNLRERVKSAAIPNVRTHCADGLEVRGEWDAVMALFHGDVEVIGESYLKMARKRFVLVVHGSPYGSTGPEQYRVRKCCDTDHTRSWLEAHGIPYHLELGSLEFGQPHRSFEEALAYTRTYSKGAPEDELEAYVRSHVVETGQEEFPLYTPKKRSFGLFEIRKEDIK